MNKIESGELVSGYQYVNVAALGVVFQYHYAIINSRTVIRTQRLSDEQRLSNAFDFVGAQWTGTDLSPDWVRQHCEFVGTYPNPINKKIQYREVEYTLVKHGEVSGVRPRGDEWILARHPDGRLLWLPACDCYPLNHKPLK